jgi:hypothetical protein
MSVTDLVSKLGLVRLTDGLRILRLFATKRLRGRIHSVGIWDVSAKSDAFPTGNCIVRAYDEALARMPIAR